MTETSDEAIERRVIGGPDIHDDTIYLSPYDERWPAAFAAEDAPGTRRLRSWGAGW